MTGKKYKEVQSKQPVCMSGNEEDNLQIKQIHNCVKITGFTVCAVKRLS
jgi:hypothetical protein